MSPPRSTSRRPSHSTQVIKILSCAEPAHILRDIAADNVIKDLLALFARLGLDAGQIIDRVELTHRADRDVPQPAPRFSELSSLLTLWHQDPKYLDSSGNPAPMKMSGGRKSFRKIANVAVPNVAAAKLLRELVRLRAVRVDKKGFIHAKTRTLSIYEDKQLGALHTLGSLRGFINTLHHNLDSAPANSDQLFHRIAWNGEFDKVKVPQLKIWLRRHGQNLLESVDIWMMDKTVPRGVTRRRKAVRASVGLYLSVDES
jgi:Family of unknown function (DUF6502)